MPSLFTGQHERILLKEGGEPKKIVSIDGESFVVKAKSFT
jgi:hypothetical protein